MENELLKSAVLAKCGEVAPILYGNYPFENKTIERTTHEIRIFSDWGVVRFSEKTPAGDDVWPLAAQILGIAGKPEPITIEYVNPCTVYNVTGTAKVMPEPRPSDDLLLKAYKTGYYGCGSIERFNNFLATLPPDPLADDRAAIQNEFANGLERKLIDAYCTGDAIAAMKRFAGMEVSND